jgi:hypothetical protein
MQSDWKAFFLFGKDGSTPTPGDVTCLSTPDCILVKTSGFLTFDIRHARVQEIFARDLGYELSGHFDIILLIGQADREMEDYNVKVI